MFDDIQGRGQYLPEKILYIILQNILNYIRMFYFHTLIFQKYALLKNHVVAKEYKKKILMALA